MNYKNFKNPDMNENDTMQSCGGYGKSFMERTDEDSTQRSESEYKEVLQFYVNALNKRSRIRHRIRTIATIVNYSLLGVLAIMLISKFRTSKKKDTRNKKVKNE